MSRHIERVLVWLVLILVIPSEAKAYTDPGSGALIWQIAVAAFVGGIFYLRRLLSWFRTGKKNKKP